MGTEESAPKLSDDEIAATKAVLNQRRRDRTSLQERQRRARDASELASFRHWIDKVQDEIDWAAEYLRRHGVDP